MTSPSATTRLTYQIKCERKRHPIILDVSRWGDVTVVENPCGLAFWSFDYNYPTCHQNLDFQLASSRVFHQQFLVDPFCEHESRYLPTELRAGLRKFWSNEHGDDFAPIAEMILEQADFDGEPIVEGLWSNNPEHVWASLIQIEHQERRDLVPEIIRHLPHFSLSVGLHAVCLLSRIAPNESSEILAEWSKKREVIAPLRENWIKQLASATNAKVIPHLIDNWIFESGEQGPDYPSVANIPALSRTSLAAMFDLVRQESAARFRDLVVDMFLEERTSREKMLDLLAEIGCDELAMWIELLDHFRWRVRVASIQILSRLNNPQVIKPVLDSLRSNPPNEVADAAEDCLAKVVGQFADHDEVQRVLPQLFLSLPYPKLTKAAIDVLDGLPDETAIAHLLDALATTRLAARVKVIGALGQRQAHAAIPALVEILQSDLMEQKAAASVLQNLVKTIPLQHASAISWLRLGLLCDDVESAQTCAAQLFEIDTEETFTILCENIGVVLPDVCVQICEGFKSQLDTRAIEPLLECLPRRGEWVQKQIAIAIGSLLRQLDETRHDVDLAVKVLQSTYAPVAIDAAQRLEKIGDLSVIETLDSVRTSPEVVTAAKAARETILRDNPTLRSDQPTEPSPSIKRWNSLSDRIRKT